MSRPNDDNAGHAMIYHNDAMGGVYQIDAPGATTQIALDPLFGRKIGMSDSDTGTRAYAYNSFGELCWQRDAKGQYTAIFRDLLGRKVKQVEGGSPDRNIGTRTAQWGYDTAPHGSNGTWAGKLASVTVDTPASAESYTYDDLGRVAEKPGGLAVGSKCLGDGKWGTGARSS